MDLQPPEYEPDPKVAAVVLTAAPVGSPIDFRPRRRLERPLTDARAPTDLPEHFPLPRADGSDQTRHGRAN